MPGWLIFLFVFVEVLATIIVVRAVLSNRGGFSALFGIDLKRIMALSNEMERETEEYLRANWSGDPMTLSTALTPLLDKFEARVREQALPVSREQLKPMLGRLVLARQLASAHDVQEALKLVA
jgi:hypothetical protein